MNKVEYSHDHLAFTIPNHISVKLEQFNDKIENDTGIKFGRSFVVRIALEELFKRMDAPGVVMDRKLDIMRAKILA